MIRLLRPRIPQLIFSPKGIHSLNTKTKISRSPGSGSNWTQQDLEAFNISIRFENATTFFQIPTLPEPAVSEDILTTMDPDNTTKENTYRLLTQLDLAMVPGAVESAVDDLASLLFHELGYTRHPHALRSHLQLELLVCGEHRYAKPDICIIDRSRGDIIMLVEEDKRKPLPGADALPRLAVFPQLIAEAIGAHQHNDAIRMAIGLDPLDSKVGSP